MNENDASRVPRLKRIERWAERTAKGCILTLILGGFLCYLGAAALDERYWRTSHTLSVAIASLCFLALALAITVIAALVVGIAAQTRLRLILQKAKGLLCPGCGYNLAGVTSGRCPECGRAYDKHGVATEWRDEYATALPSSQEPAPARPQQDKDAANGR